MDYKNLTAPCGRDCFNCPIYLVKDNLKMQEVFSKKYNMKKDEVSCKGCRNIDGKCNFLKALGFSEQCKIYKCCLSKKIDFCHECRDFPCDLLHPLADRATEFPHNLKVFNLCQIKKMGVEEWGKNFAKKSFEKYYKDKIDL